MTSLLFNAGTNFFANSKLLKKLNNGDDAGAAKEFLDIDNIKDKNGIWRKEPGLTKRRKDESKTFMSGLE